MSWHYPHQTQHSIYWRKLAKTGGTSISAQFPSACLIESQSLRLKQGQREALWSLKDQACEAPTISLPLGLSSVVPAIKHGKILVSYPGLSSQDSWLIEDQRENLYRRKNLEK